MCASRVVASLPAVASVILSTSNFTTGYAFEFPSSEIPLPLIPTAAESGLKTESSMVDILSCPFGSTSSVVFGIEVGGKASGVKYSIMKCVSSKLPAANNESQLRELK